MRLEQNEARHAKATAFLNQHRRFDGVRDSLPFTMVLCRMAYHSLTGVFPQLCL